MIIDTHSHIYLEDFDEDRFEMIERARAAGVERILLPNIDSDSVERLHQTAAAFDNCLPMMGLHPTSVKGNYAGELKIIEQYLFNRSYVAVGEIGIDLYWDKTFKREQIIAFETQIKWAILLQLPIVIHCREAFPEVLDVVDRLYVPGLKGVFHSFSGGAEEAQHIINYKTFKLGINGVVTYKKSTLPEVLKSVDPSFLVVETDAPYLTPVPHRGKRNEPSYLTYIINQLSAIYGMSPQNLKQVLYQNAQTLFNV